MYFDYWATSPLLPNVISNISNLLDIFGNASSIHASGRLARHRIEEVRRFLSDDLNFPAENIIFTSSASEANAMVLRGFSGHIITSTVEHSSVLKNTDSMFRVAVNTEGFLDMSMLEDMLRKAQSPALVSMMIVNNETGIIFPIKDIIILAKKYNALVHVDAVQGYKRLDLREINADFLTISGHKIGSLKGVGVLAFKNKNNVKPLFFGGGQEYFLRPGTENVLAIATLGIAAKTEYPVREIIKKQQYLESGLKIIAPNGIIIGENSVRIAGCTNFVLPNFSSEFQVIALDQKGICVGAGSACSSGRLKKSHVLIAMGLEKLAGCEIRISIGHNTQDSDIDMFLEHYEVILAKGCSIL